MKHSGLILIVCMLIASPAFGQTDNLIRELEKRRADLLSQIKESESLLNTTKKDVSGQLNTLATLTGQVDERKRYIAYLNNDIETINRESYSLEKQLVKLETELVDKKRKYEASIQYLYKNKSIEERLLFILSAETLAQTYRRLRYVKEYATYQRLQGEELMVKQEEIKIKKEELRQAKAAKQQVLKEIEEERQRLEVQEKQMKTLVANLQKKQKGLQDEVAKKRREANQLNTRIDKLIAEEIEKTRKAAEAQARKEAAARGEKPPPPSKKAEAAGTFTLSKADKELSGSFVNNRGKLPVPVTGPYTVVGKFGQYTVEGLRNVKLDNKGIDIQAKSGAEAKAVFDGVVTAVFQFQANGLFNVLIRHGNYISVYCNLSSTSVKQGDKVKINQSIGKIFSDKTDGRTVLHFQLHKERELLNPEPWLNR